jgi:SAM-dependent methyltransferase
MLLEKSSQIFHRKSRARGGAFVASVVAAGARTGVECGTGSKRYTSREFMKKTAARYIPDFLKPTLKKIYYFPVDIIDRWKRRNGMIPPKSMIFIGDGDFEQAGREFKKYFIELANFQPNNRVLDVGCGIGRMAIPLTDYLSPEGEYWGFDIVKKGVAWCQNRISPRFGNFHFLHSDVYNKHYNPKGKVQARDFRFPFNDETFDFVFLTSVFTHMLPSDMENYLSEISRVLKAEGKCLITFFLMNEESESLVRSGRSTLDFRFEMQDCLTVSENDPEAAIAYREEFVTKVFEKHGVRIVRPIHYGSWCKRERALTYQDLIIATKKGIPLRSECRATEG